MAAPACIDLCLASRSTAVRRARRVCATCRAHVVRRARDTTKAAAAIECNVSHVTVAAWCHLADHADARARLAVKAATANRLAILRADG